MSLHQTFKFYLIIGLIALSFSLITAILAIVLVDGALWSFASSFFMMGFMSTAASMDFRQKIEIFLAQQNQEAEQQTTQNDSA